MKKLYLTLEPGQFFENLVTGLKSDSPDQSFSLPLYSDRRVLSEYKILYIYIYCIYIDYIPFQIKC